MAHMTWSLNFIIDRGAYQGSLNQCQVPRNYISYYLSLKKCSIQIQLELEMHHRIWPPMVSTSKGM